MFRLVFGLMLLAVSLVTAAADTGSELQRLYSALNMLNQEQQAIYQQFQMVQELRRNNGQTLYGAQVMPMQTTGDVPNYVDVVAAQKSIIRRGEDLDRQAQQLLEKYSDIEEQKKPIRQEIVKLTTAK